MHSPALAPRQRKSTGAYYTPPELIHLLLTHALPANPTDAPLKILDPACGPGDFLAAARRLAPSAHLHGIDIDPTALSHCRAALAHSRARNAETSTRNFILAHTDALLSPPPFLTPECFDLILGNPPYVNGIERHLAPAYKDRLRAAFPRVRGAADLAHYFLDQATRLVRAGGRVAFVLPRAILNSPAARPLRAGLPPHLRPNLIYAPERSDFFHGAAVFVCLLILGPDDHCLVSTDPDPVTATFRPAPITGDNWWLPLHRAQPTQSAGPTLASRFQVTASMTAAEAYDLLPHLTDSPDDSGLKFVTTGLIEPNACLWGARTCRYLKRDFRHPRLSPSADLPRSLARRAASARRPKILLAGLARRIEAFLDPCGEYLGAVSTYTILHPHDDLRELGRLLDHLLAPATTDQLVHHLGANGLRGRHITLKKSFLRDLPLPA